MDPSEIAETARLIHSRGIVRMGTSSPHRYTHRDCARRLPRTHGEGAAEGAAGRRVLTTCGERVLGSGNHPALEHLVRVGRGDLVDELGAQLLVRLLCVGGFGLAASALASFLPELIAGRALVLLDDFVGDRVDDRKLLGRDADRRYSQREGKRDIETFHREVLPKYSRVN